MSSSTWCVVACVLCGDAEQRDQVLRLTESTLLDPSQLIHQAVVISALVAQRDFLVRQAEEERERWTSEKDGWSRMAEALISQRNKPANSAAKDAVRIWVWISDRS